MSIALYRRYRPETFQEVIGQSHVTKPLMAALSSGRTTHAYLFSGPRGCGKTTSARILARCLNCAEYPTDTPCGTCDSCIELARDGSGSLDVVELDAASHGGVDDARELREQAGFAPVRDRFKIFIIDEAHMVSNQGFNALLKVVEEPPEHVKFIFATTEPDKVIGTIRSRTHHYPFRLVPPTDLEDYLARICADEGIEAPREVLGLAVRAGTGSVRDTLSVLDQLIGGSEGTRLDYNAAVSLLGYTSAALLDDAVSAIAARSGSGLFSVVDSVVKSGHDPRRFVEDLLQRLRDLVIISLTGEGADDVFVSVPDDQYARMREQAQELGAQRASRAADLTNEALTQMVGATAPRLQLELLCARLIVDGEPVPVTEPSAPSVAPAGLDKWRKPADQTSPQSSGPAQPTMPPLQQSDARAQQVQPQIQPAPNQPVNTARVAPERRAMPPMPSDENAPQQMPAPVSPAQPTVQPQQPGESRAVPQTSQQTAPSIQRTPVTNGDLALVQARWSEVVDVVRSVSKVAASQAEQSEGPVVIEGDVLIIGFAMPGIAQAFARHSGEVSTAISQIFGLQFRVEGRAGYFPKGDAAQAAAPVAQWEAVHASGDQQKMPSASVMQQAPGATSIPERASVSVPAPETVAEARHRETAYLESDFSDLAEEPDPDEAPPETDPIYGLVREDDSRIDPAGVLGPLLDGTAKFVGDDHTSSPTASHETSQRRPAPEGFEFDVHLNEPALKEPTNGLRSNELEEPGYAPEFEPIEHHEPHHDDVPFYAQDMPDLPPSEPPLAWHRVEPAEDSVTEDFLTRSAELLVKPRSERPTPRDAHHANTPAVPEILEHLTHASNHSNSSVDESEWDEVSEDDPEVSTVVLGGIDMLMQRFNAQIVEEIREEGADGRRL